MQVDSERLKLRTLIREAAAKRDASGAVEAARNLVSTSSTLIDMKFCASVFAELAEALKLQVGVRALRIFIVRSVTVEPILPYLAVEAVFSNLLLDTRLGGFGSYFDEMLNPQSDLAKAQPDLVLVLLDLEDIAGRLPDLCADGRGRGVEQEIDESVLRMEQLLRGFRSSSSARLLVQGCVIPDRTSLGDVGDANLRYSLPNAVLELNLKLAEACRTIPDCAFFDVDRLAARFGRENWRDQRLFLTSRLAVSADAFKPYSRGLIRAASSLFRAPRKVLCTDLDNTLWGGVLGEDGPEGIATGTAFPGSCYLEYQRYLRQLSARGILLAIVSKNNEADVQEAFQIRAADIAIGLNDFVATKISWQEKATSIRELANELSLGLDSFVFVDDNPVECAAIRQHLPEVTVIAAPLEEPWRLVEILSELPSFDTVAITEDDVNRLTEYKAQAQRTELATAAGNRDDFLASLNIVCTFLSALDAPLSRAAQLLAKTNQFNLTTRRHSSAEIESFASDPGAQAIAVRVRDRFGDAGVVGIALARTEGDTCLIDSLLLSCRVIGRGIETALLAHIAKNAREAGAQRLVGERIPTKKNAPCAEFYSEHGFVRSKPIDGMDSTSTYYEYDLTTATPMSPAWITLEGTESHELSRSAALSS